MAVGRDWIFPKVSMPGCTGINKTPVNLLVAHGQVPANIFNGIKPTIFYYFKKDPGSIS